MEKNVLKRYRYEIIIFIADVICMILELIASRLLSPYFGSSNIVWTSVIGIILLSSSIGNYLGGKIADKNNIEKNLKFILMATSIFILIIPFLQSNILTIISKYIENIKIGAIISTIFLFFIPSLGMGLLTPIILRLKLNNMQTAGKTTGTINAIATIGGITGTFLGGFLLIPNLGSINILLILVILLVWLIPLVNFKLKEKSTIIVVIITIISLLSLYINTISNNINGEQVLQGKRGTVSYDTQYGRVLIYNTVLNENNVRILNIDSGFESATFTDEDKVNELVFDYTKYYDLMFNAKIDINNVLLIGGAGYSYPKYYISHYPNKNMDVVEIDEGITNIAKEYFYLNKLIKDYNLEENQRLKLIHDDGRTYLNNNSKKYDAILNDAFSGNTPAKTLTTLEHNKNIKKSLNENGVYLTNIISSLEGKNSKFLKAEVNTLKQVFKNVYIVPCNYTNDTEQGQNNMIIATDSDIIYENTYNYNLATKQSIELTDIIQPYGLTEDEINSKIKQVTEEAVSQEDALSSAGYETYKRDLASPIYQIENIHTFFLGSNGDLYIIFAYGNNNYTSEMDIIKMQTYPDIGE